MPQPALSALAAMTEPPALRPWPQAMASSQATSWPACRWPPTVILPPARTSHLARALPAQSSVSAVSMPHSALMSPPARSRPALAIWAPDWMFSPAITDSPARMPPPAMMPRPARTTESTLMPLRTSIVPANTTALASISSSRSTASVGPNWSSSQQASPTRPSATRASSTA